MSFTGSINKVTFGLRKSISRTCLIWVTAVSINWIPADLCGLSPTKRLDSEYFTCVKKGFFPERICEEEEVLDDFLDNEGSFGITGRRRVQKAGIEEAVDEIFTETMDEEQALKVDALLKALQKEADVFLEEDFRKGQRISLEEAIYLALRDNEGVGFDAFNTLTTNISTGITSGYLNRELQKQQLLAFLETWTPNLTTTLATNFVRTYTRRGPYTTTVTLPAPSINAVQLLKSGTNANVTFSWTNSYSYTQISGRPRNTTATSTLNLQLTQPLLQGAGFEIGTIPLTNAYLNDEVSINNLAQIVIDNVTLTITTYRAYLQAIDEFEIDKRAIYKGRDDLAQTKALVAAGRRARADIVERQRYLAQQEFNFQDQRNTVDQRRIDFLRQINMDTSTNVVPEDLEVLDLEPEDLPTIEELMTILFLHNPTYLTQLIQYRQAELNYMLARNNTLWQLQFTAGITASGTSNQANLPLSSLGRSNEKAWDFRDRSVNVGLALTIPINQLEARKSALLGAKIGLREAQISLRKREQDLTAQVKNSLRSIKKDIIQIKLAKINTELSKKRVVQKRLEIEGGLSSAFELTGVQDDLISAEKAEVDAKVTFMNDIATLDGLLGTTFDSWGINLLRRTEHIPKLSDTLFGKIKTHIVR